MSYVARVLQPGEAVIRTAHLHWIMYVRPVLIFVVVGIVSGFASRAAPDERNLIYMAAAALAAIGFFGLFVVWFRRWTTEIAVTDRRVIYKTGFIRRDTREMNIHRVETVHVEQSVLGRLLDYGTVSIRGTGAGIENVVAVSDPLGVRSAVTAPQV